MASQGIYNDVSATAIQIGGSNNLPVPIGGVANGVAFGSVSLDGGLSVTGLVSASALSATIGKGNATAIDFGSGSNVAALNNSGSLVASDGVAVGGSGPSGTNVIGVKIEPGGSLASLTNSGSIIAASIVPATPSSEQRGGR